MENIIIWIVGIGATVFLFLSVIVAHAKQLRGHAKQQWDDLRELLSERQDYLPNLVETVRENTEGQQAVIQKVVDTRAKACRVNIPGLDKFESEMALSKAIAEMNGLVKQFPKLAHDTNFLELNSDIKNVSRRIERQTSTYNTEVRKYNRFRRFFPFLERVAIFEFEE